MNQVDRPSQVPATDTPPEVDGRRLRSERTKRLIVEAFLALLRDDPQMPTATQIAARAGYSVRSIFERFPDLNALRIAAADFAFAEAGARSVARNIDADRPTRLKTQVEGRAQTCEQWLPLWRALSTTANDSEELRLRLRFAREAVRKRIELMYKPELEPLPEPARKRTLLAIELLTEFESWGRMRELHGLSFEDACTVWIDAIDRLLPPTPAVS
ncbi:MAG: TetR/AcrR family transcriptional regulator [Reyranellales bacterium]